MKTKIIFKISSLIILLFICCTAFLGCKSSSKDSYTSSVVETDIAKLSLFAYDGKSESTWGLMNLGHAFVSIENISEESLSIIDKVLAPGETVSIGTWSILEHFGVWYNVESVYIETTDKYNGRYSATIGINTEDLEKIVSFISEKDKWNPIHNCSYFALNLWNEVAEESEFIETPFIYTPTYISKELEKFDSFMKNKPIPGNGKMGYFKDSTYVSFEMEGGYESV